MKKVYYQLKMTQQSPLRIGNGDNEFTDSDLMLDGRGIPFIPGSSVAGVIRDIYERRLGKDARELFGDVNGSDITDSRILVSDAVGPDGVSADKYIISERDGIGLDDWGVTIKGTKYNFQVVETNVPYVCVLEWNGDDTCYESDVTNGIDKLIQLLLKDGISFGARTTRGYGHMQVSARKKEFDCSKQECIELWLNFDPFALNAFDDEDEITIDGQSIADSEAMIDVHLRIKDGFSVRVSTSRTEPEDDGSLPDSVPLSSKVRKAGEDFNPVIPGTAWAGVFRHHMQDLLREIQGIADKKEEARKIDELFGKSREDGNHIKSSISFNEVEVTGGEYYAVTRNAVDRFTAAPKNTALFTEKLYRGGTGDLIIRVEKEKINLPEYSLQKQLFIVTLVDLNLGLVAFGGTSGVGRGRAEVESVDIDGVKTELDMSVLEGAI